MTQENQPPADTDLLRDLGSLLEQSQAEGQGVSGSIEIAAVKMQVAKEAMQTLRGLRDKRRELMLPIQGIENCIKKFKDTENEENLVKWRAELSQMKQRNEAAHQIERKAKEIKDREAQCQVGAIRNEADLRQFLIRLEAINEEISENKQLLSQVLGGNS